MTAEQQRPGSFPHSWRWRGRVWAQPRLITLLDVLEFSKTSNLLGLFQALRTLDGALGRITRDEEAALEDRESAEADLQTLLVDCVRRIGEASSDLGIPGLEDRCARLQRSFADGKIGSETIQYEAAGVAASIKSELRSKTFFVVETRDEAYYTDSLIKGEAASRFPCAGEELNEAGKCFALGRYTASVFHAMRALEPALEVLRRNVRAPKGGSWGPIIDQVEAKIRQVQTGGKPSTKARKRFLSEAAAEFRHFKDAWRNHTMHTHQRYDRDTAKRILEHVKTFVEHLSSRLSERRRSRRQ